MIPSQTGKKLSGVNFDNVLNVLGLTRDEDEQKKAIALSYCELIDLKVTHIDVKNPTIVYTKNQKDEAQIISLSAIMEYELPDKLAASAGYSFYSNGVQVSVSKMKEDEWSEPKRIESLNYTHLSIDQLLFFTKMRWLVRLKRGEV